MTKTRKAKKDKPVEVTTDNIAIELEDTKAKYLRTLADLENLRKRSQIERETFAAFALEQFVQTLLPIIDNFERAIGSSEKSNVPEDFLKGIALIKKQFEDSLTKFGVTPIESIGKPFDPHQHEVVMKRKEDGKEDGIVLEVVQPGYTLHKKIIRPAMVIIAGE